MQNFASLCEDLWQQVKPLYQKLHAYVRRKLMDCYPDNLKDFPSTRQIPAHILGESSRITCESNHPTDELHYITIKLNSSV